MEKMKASAGQETCAEQKRETCAEQNKGIGNGRTPLKSAGRPENRTENGHPKLQGFGCFYFASNNEILCVQRAADGQSAALENMGIDHGGFVIPSAGSRAMQAPCQNRRRRVSYSLH
jgi:hypothetical protein